MDDIDKIEAVLQAAAEVELNLDSGYARKILAERIKSALDRDDTNDCQTFSWRYNHHHLIPHHVWQQIE